MHVTTPATKGVAAHSGVAPSKNDAVPVGTAILGVKGLTTAVKTTGWPKTAVPLELDSDTCTFPAATETVTWLEALAEKLLSPA